MARGLQKLGLVSETEGEGKQWRFLGIWAKNRAEWAISTIASWYNKGTVVGFYDAMSNSAVDFILNQTEMSTILVAAAYVDKIVAMKKDGLAGNVKNLVVFDELKSAQVAACEEHGVTLIDLAAVYKAGSEASDVTLEKPAPSDIYIFSYTSGTTGDSKGVKLSHRNIMSSVGATLKLLPIEHTDVVISYLPYPHSFEQCMFGLAMITGCKVGYYQGDPLKLVEDCAVLKPTIFPSVPRLYNRIYGKIKAKFDEATGCKSWLLNKGINSKIDAYNANATYTSGCYDRLIFRKVAALLGGRCRMMVTGSAPID